jgi:hypothetical protein
MSMRKEEVLDSNLLYLQQTTTLQYRNMMMIVSASSMFHVGEFNLEFGDFLHFKFFWCGTVRYVHDGN